jgi:chromosome segregation ATPase
LVIDWAPIIVAVAALAGTIYTAIIQRQTSRDTHAVSDAANAINAYRSLCESLQSLIDMRSREIEELRQQIAALEERQLKREEELTARIAALEQERDDLKRQLATLRAEYCAGKKGV